MATFNSGISFMRLIKVFLSILISSFAIQAEADDRSASKANYTIFNPTPRTDMREFSTDRPDKMESSYTLDAGHFQHETDIINVVFNNDDGVNSTNFLFVAPNLKVGITNNVDLQFVVETYNYNREKVEGRRSKQSGFGDLTTRLKVNVLGNDRGDIALAIMPFIKFPTNHRLLGNSSIEGGVVAPLTINLSEETSLGFMGQIDIVRDAESDGYHGEYIYLVNLGQSLTEDSYGYIEFWSSLSSERGANNTIDIGIAYAVVEDTQLDIGINVGVTENADDLNPFIGISQRF